MIRTLSLLAACAFLPAAEAGCQVAFYTKCVSPFGSLGSFFGGSAPKICDWSSIINNIYQEDTADGLPEAIWGYTATCGVTLYKEANYQGDSLQLGTSACFCDDDNGSALEDYRSLTFESFLPEDAFSVVFFSDVEENYRGHKSTHAQRVIDAMKGIKNRNLKYDGKFADVKVEPELWIHGGDMANYWDVTFWDDLFGDDDGADNAWNGIWKDFYSSDKVMISTFGNHDWHRAADDHILSSGDRSTNKKTRDFVQKVMEHARTASDGDLSFQRITPAGDIGQSYYVVDFKGLQIGVMGWEPLLASSDNSGNPIDETAQWNSFKAAMDPSKTTLFVSHTKLTSMTSSSKNAARSFYDNWEDLDLPAKAGQTYPAAAHLGGHSHRWGQKGYRGRDDDRVQDYTVTYPYDNYGGSGEKRGFYSVLVSPTHGVLQVKQHEFTTDCWERGTLCAAGSTCEQHCCYDGGVKYDWWWTKMFTACGEFNCIGSGKACVPATTCHGCCKGSFIAVCL